MHVPVVKTTHMVTGMCAMPVITTYSYRTMDVDKKILMTTLSQRTRSFLSLCPCTRLLQLSHIQSLKRSTSYFFHYIFGSNSMYVEDVFGLFSAFFLVFLMLCPLIEHCFFQSGALSLEGKCKEGSTGLRAVHLSKKKGMR